MYVRLSLLLSLLLCCSFAVAQVTLSADVGIGYGMMNHAPGIVERTDFFRSVEDAQDEYLRPSGGESMAINLGYDRPGKKLGYRLRVQGLRRGYQHVVRATFPQGTFFQDNFSSEATFIDVQPQVQITLTERLRLLAGPYVSVSVSETRNPLRPEGQLILHREDFGATLGFQFAWKRFYVHGQYQHSLRPFSLTSFPDYNPGFAIPDNPSPIGVALVGVGYQIIRGKDRR